MTDKCFLSLLQIHHRALGLAITWRHVHIALYLCKVMNKSFAKQFTLDFSASSKDVVSVSFFSKNDRPCNDTRVMTQNHHTVSDVHWKFCQKTHFYRLHLDPVALYQHLRWHLLPALCSVAFWKKLPSFFNPCCWVCSLSVECTNSLWIKAAAKCKNVKL